MIGVTSLFTLVTNRIIKYLPKEVNHKKGKMRKMNNMHKNNNAII